MGSRRREVIWSKQAAAALDQAVAYVSQDSPPAGIRLLEAALGAASSLAALADRGRVVPEIGSPVTRELFILEHRLMYEVAENQVHVIAFLHGARDFARWRREQ